MWAGAQKGLRTQPLNPSSKPRLHCTYLSFHQNHCVAVVCGLKIQAGRDTCLQKPREYCGQEGWSNTSRLLDRDALLHDGNGTGVMNSDWCRWQQHGGDDAHLALIVFDSSVSLWATDRRAAADTKWLSTNVSWNKQQRGQGWRSTCNIPVCTRIQKKKTFGKLRWCMKFKISWYFYVSSQISDTFSRELR